MSFFYDYLSSSSFEKSWYPECAHNLHGTSLNVLPLPSHMSVKQLDCYECKKYCPLAVCWLSFLAIRNSFTGRGTNRNLTAECSKIPSIEVVERVLPQIASINTILNKLEKFLKRTVDFQISPDLCTKIWLSADKMHKKNKKKSTIHKI